MSVTRLKNLLKSSPGGDLDSLVERARQMGELTQRLQAVLEPGLASSLQAANLREDGALVLICQSSTWAARLRFEADKLMEAARSGGADVTSCKVTVSRDTRD